MGMVNALVMQWLHLRCYCDSIDSHSMQGSRAAVEMHSRQL